MLLFGHTGITLGVAMVLKSTLARVQSRGPEASVEPKTIVSGSVGYLSKHTAATKSRLFSLLDRADVRVLLVG
jgi:hypothetical protein